MAGRGVGTGSGSRDRPTPPIARPVTQGATAVGSATGRTALHPVSAGIRPPAGLGGRGCPGDERIERGDRPLRGPPAEGSAGGVLFSLHRARTDRAASLVNRRTNPRGLTAAERGVQSRYRLERRPKRPGYERVRSLRTQQRAESQCQVVTPFVGFFGLMDIESVQFSVLGLVQASTESLILAQDERWRRA